MFASSVFTCAFIFVCGITPLLIATVFQPSHDVVLWLMGVGAVLSVYGLYRFVKEIAKLAEPPKRTGEDGRR